MNDTDPVADRVHVELLRRAGAERRSRLASDLTNQALARARAGIALARPELSDSGRQLLFVEVHYGRDLADGVRRRLRSKHEAR